MESLEETNSKDTNLFLESLHEIGEIPSVSLESEDAEAEQKSTNTIYKISELEGRMNIGLWNNPKLVKEMLDSASCFVLDCQVDYHSHLFLLVFY